MAIKPIKVPEDILENIASAPAEEQFAFSMQIANIRMANALTAIAIHIGAMDEEGNFIPPKPEPK